eukprot:sb/3473926/
MHSLVSHNIVIRRWQTTIRSHCTVSSGVTVSGAYSYQISSFINITDRLGYSLAGKHSMKHNAIIILVTDTVLQCCIGCAQTAHAQNLAQMSKILVNNFSNPSGIGKLAERLGQNLAHLGKILGMGSLCAPIHSTPAEMFLYSFN